jgi:hypothetical protein
MVGTTKIAKKLAPPHNQDPVYVGHLDSLEELTVKELDRCTASPYDPAKLYQDGQIIDQGFARGIVTSTERRKASVYFPALKETKKLIHNYTVPSSTTSATEVYEAEQEELIDRLREDYKIVPTPKVSMILKPYKPTEFKFSRKMVAKLLHTTGNNEVLTEEILEFAFNNMGAIFHHYSPFPEKGRDYIFRLSQFLHEVSDYVSTNPETTMENIETEFFTRPKVRRGIREESALTEDDLDTLVDEKITGYPPD